MSDKVNNDKLNEENNLDNSADEKESLKKDELIKDVEVTEKRVVKFTEVNLTPLYFALFFLSFIDFVCYGFMMIKLDEYALSTFSFIVFLGTIYYALIGYKKSKSQILRILLLCFSVILVIIPVLFYTYLMSVGIFNIEHKVFLILNAVAACVCAFIAGRIHHYNKNKILVILVFVLLLSSAIIEFESINDYTALYNSSVEMESLSTIDSFISNLLPFTSTIQWGCLMIAYTVKFQNHELRKTKHHKHKHKH